jgi:two-component system, cell cycle response regulator
MPATPRTGELTPVEDRIRWMLLCRAVLAVGVVTIWWLSTERSHATGVYIAALGWPTVTAVSLLVSRLGRWPARLALTVSLLGDGILLAAAWWATGTLDGPMGYLVAVHLVAVTLLASFRTGVKLAVWHPICSLLFLEAKAAGMLGQAVPVPLAQFGLYVGALWMTVLGTASFAAVNERELRRRRYDSEALLRFSGIASAATDVVAVSGSLARFARDELLARRAAVVVHVDGSEPGDQARALGVVAGEPPDEEACVLDPRDRPESIVTEAVRRSTTILRRRLDHNAEPWLAQRFPDARGLVVVPFAVDRISGALVLEPRLGRWSRRVEQRVVSASEQATAHGAIAIERAVLTERIRAASRTDSLTRVANRRHFDDRLLADVERARKEGTALSLVMVDADHFKRLNDEHGHQVGDEVLQQVAQAIRAECGDPHLVARYGGEEFAVILVGVDGTGALGIAERIRVGVGVGTAETRIAVTASLGVASFPDHAEAPADLIASADAALYEAKRNGRNRVALALPRSSTTVVLASTAGRGGGTSSAASAGR